MVSFNQIQPNWKLPGTSVEVDPSLAGTPTAQKYALLAGYKLAGGSAPSNVPIAVGTQSDADTYFGAGSMLSRMFSRFFALTKGVPIFCLPLDAPSGGAAATGTITVSSAPSAAGILNLYIAGQNVSVSIGASDSANTVAASIEAAINAATDLPVTAGVATDVVTLTSKWKGISGNDIRMEDSLLGFYGGEQLPTGLALTYSGTNFLTGGSGVPTWTTAIANMGDAAYRWFACPFNDSGSYTALDTEYGFGDGGRWGWIRQVYGEIFSGYRDTYSNLMTWGVTNNSAVISPMPWEVATPAPLWECVAAYTARAAGAFNIDPARPLQTLTLDGIMLAPKATRFNKTQLNALAQTGLAIQGDMVGVGVTQILREQSSYQKNTQGIADNAYELVTTLETLAEIFTRLRQSVSDKYPRHKLANDGTRFASGLAIVTPNLIKAELISEYRAMEYDGLVENTDTFIANLIVQRSSTDPNTVECVYPPDIINQLRRFNVLAQFRLQFPVVS
jgi:phage tail sheath gpL-like